MVLRARYVLPIDRPPIENGWLAVAGDRIVGLGAGRGGRSDEEDLGDAALLPGLVNAHTHLELSDLHGRVPYSGSFAEWIETLLSVRQENPEEQPRRLAIRRGVAESLSAGVTTVGDIGYGPWQGEELAAAPLRAVCFAEILGIGGSVPQAQARIDEVGRRPPLTGPKLWSGLAPHAPYSTAAEVYGRCAEEARRRGWRLTTHLAETTEELRFLATGDGPLRDLLDRQQLLDATFAPAGVTPVAFAKAAGLLDQPTLLAHLNYVSDEELDALAASPCSVAYCPRTHRFFGHPPHRFRDLLARGINVCVATDSLASSPSLSVLEELRFLRAEHPDLPPRLLLEMGTLRAAAALGLADRVGTLAPGKLADFVVLPVARCTIREVEDQILADPVRPARCVVAGLAVRER